MAGHLGILLRARAAGWRNAVSRQSPSSIAAIGLAVVAVCGGAIGLGELAWEGLSTAPEQVATMRLGDRPIAGENALETAFWLSFLAAAVLGFRVMEVLFRRGDMRMLDRLPLTPTALFFDRVVVAFGEALLTAIPLGLFFVPLGVHGFGWAAASAVLLVFAALLTTVLICVGANIYIGVQFGDPRARGLSDAYGGAGGAFIYGPAAGMFGSAIAALILKLAAGELLKAQGWSNAVGLGLALAFGFAIALFITGLRDYRRGAHLVAAWFNEADSVGFEAVMDYQESSWASDGWHRRLPGRAGSVYRRLALELPRRHPLARWLYTLGAAATAVGFWSAAPSAFPVWVPVALSVAMVGVLANPWARVRGLSGAQAFERFPISEGEERLAATIRGFRDAAAVAIAMCAAAVAGSLLGGRPLDVGLAAVVAQLVAYPIGVAGLLAALPYARWKSLSKPVSVVIGLALMGAVLVSATAGLVAAAAAAGVGLPLIVRAVAQRPRGAVA